MDNLLTIFRRRHITIKIGSVLFVSFIVALFPQYVFASGIGFHDFSGSVSISNSEFRGNFIGIQFTTTNAASTANKTIDNIWIGNNIIDDSRWHGIEIANTTGATTIDNNALDNSGVPDTGSYTKNGRFGIRIKNHSAPFVVNNTITNFGRSGIALQNIAQVSVVNNIIQSNGTQDYVEAGEHYASGIQVKDSTFVNVSDNYITSNLFAGISAYGTGGLIGPDNTIRYDGDPSLTDPGGGGGVLEGCVATAEGGGSYRGGILVQAMSVDQEMTVMCTNTISGNYYEDVKKSGGAGTVSSCGNVVSGNFISDNQAVYFFQGTTTANLDCGGGIIDAKFKPFGIVIAGAATDVTIQNCTVKNAAMDSQYRATINNNGEIKYLGAGIFIANNATPLISNNYIVSNGWGLLDDRIYTEAGASGIQMRCADENTSIVNNIIASNCINQIHVKQKHPGKKIMRLTIL